MAKHNHRLQPCFQLIPLKDHKQVQQQQHELVQQHEQANGLHDEAILHNTLRILILIRSSSESADLFHLLNTYYCLSFICTNNFISCVS